MTLRIFLHLVATLTVASASEPNASDPLAARSIDASAFAVSDVWKLSVPAYAQIKAVPNHELPPRITSRNWGGIWEPYQDFRLAVGCAEGESKFPKKFDFVSPRISIRGAATDSASGHGITVKLFDNESSKEDIEVRMLKLPDSIRTDKEYEVAIISGKGSSVIWTVYVRFLTEKPTHIE